MFYSPRGGNLPGGRGGGGECLGESAGGGGRSYHIIGCVFRTWAYIYNVNGMAVYGIHRNKVSIDSVSYRLVYV